VLIGFRNRLAVLSSWIYDYVFFRRGSRLIVGVHPQHVRRLVPPDELVARPAASVAGRQAD